MGTQDENCRCFMCRIFSPLFLGLLATVAVLFTLSTCHAEDWPQFRRDERHSGWATQTLTGPLVRDYDGTILTYHTGGWVPATREVQVDNLTVRKNIVMLMGSAAGGDPRFAHGSARWASYLKRNQGYKSIPNSAYRPGLFFLESIQPKAGIETDSGHHACQYSINPTNNDVIGGYIMESGFLRFNGGVVTSRSQSDILGPTICRDDGSIGITISRQQWHGGGMYAKLFDMKTGSLFAGLWSQWGSVANDATDDEILGYTIAYDAVFAGDKLVSNFVTSAGNPQNLPKDWTWAPEVSGLCSWSLNPLKRLECRPGSWGQLSTDGTLLWTYEQTPYERIPNGWWAVGGASRKLTALSIPSLNIVFQADVGDVPLRIQEAPLVGPTMVVAIAYRDGVPYLDAYDRTTFAKLWSTQVPIVPREGGCAYWPARGTEQVTLAASGDSIVVASNGLTLLDAHTGEITWQEKLGTTYFNPVIVDGLLMVLRDDSGPGQDPVTGNCSGNGVEVWKPAAAIIVPTDTPAATATRTSVPTSTATAPPTRTFTRTVVPTRTPVVASAPTCVPGCIQVQ